MKSLNNFIVLMTIIAICATCSCTHSQKKGTSAVNILILGSCLVMDKYLRVIYTDPKRARKWTEDSLTFMLEMDQRLVNGGEITDEDWAKRKMIYNILGRAPKCFL